MTAYRHLISGEAFGVPHEPGDMVVADVPAEKLQEWLDAGLIEEAPVKAKKTKASASNIESQETEHGSSDSTPGGHSAQRAS